jgi:suppressor of fused
MTNEDADIANDDDNAPGWSAIDRALQPIYGAQEPKHYGTIRRRILGGSDPLDGISAYRRKRTDDGAPAHWHFVTYGFSELYAKESENAEYSGFGFELTFRLTDDGTDDEPPMWAMNFLQNLARYVFDSGNVFEAGHYMNLNGPIALEHDTQIVSIAFVHDPELPAIDTPHGQVEFLQVVGITEDEELALKRWATRKALDAMAPALPLYITDLGRSSLLENPAIAEVLREGSKRDGSNTGRLFIDQLAWGERKRLLRKSQFVVTLGARQVDELNALLPLRLPFEASFTLIGHDARVTFLPGTHNAAEATDEGLMLTLDDATCRELVATLKPKAGEYALRGFDSLGFEIRKTEIRDGDGQVVRVIG